MGPLIPAMTPDSYPDPARTAADSVRFPIAEGRPESALRGLFGKMDLMRTSLALTKLRFKSDF